MKEYFGKPTIKLGQNMVSQTKERNEDIRTHFITSNVVWFVPDVQGAVPCVCSQSLTSTANVDGVSRAFDITIAIRCEGSSVSGKVFNITAV